MNKGVVYVLAGSLLGLAVVSMAVGAPAMLTILLSTSVSIAVLPLLLSPEARKRGACGRSGAGK